jgi:hypothetical protein
MSIIREIEEEYWTVQCLNSVAGHREPIFWPLDGEGRYLTETAAAEVATRKLESYPSARIVHVVRRMTYGRPITRDAVS